MKIPKHEIRNPKQIRNPKSKQSPDSSPFCVNRKPLGQPLFSEAESGAVPGFRASALSASFAVRFRSAFIRVHLRLKNSGNRREPNKILTRHLTRYFFSV